MTERLRRATRRAAGPSAAVARTGFASPGGGGDEEGVNPQTRPSNWAILVKSGGKPSHSKKQTPSP